MENINKGDVIVITGYNGGNVTYTGFLIGHVGTIVDISSMLDVSVYRVKLLGEDSYAWQKPSTFELFYPGITSYLYYTKQSNHVRQER